MKATINITDEDIKLGADTGINPIMFALDKAGFQNAFLDSAGTRVVSATVSYIEANLPASVTKAIGDWRGDLPAERQTWRPFSFDLTMDDSTAVAFGLDWSDGLDNTARDLKLNPTITPGK